MADMVSQCKELVLDYVYGRNAVVNREAGISYRSSDAQGEFYEMLKKRLSPVLDRRYEFTSVPGAALRRELDVLAVMCCCHFPLLPVMSILRIEILQALRAGSRYCAIPRLPRSAICCTRNRRRSRKKTA